MRRVFPFLMIGLFCGLSSGQTEVKKISAVALGVAQVDITPAKPVLMSGYEARNTPFTGVHDPLFASALYFSGDGASMLLITADVIGFRTDFVDAVKAKVSSVIGIPPENIMLAAVHNHGGPAIKADEDEVTSPNEEYIKILMGKLVDLSVEASKRGVPFRMGIGRGSCRMNINRRAVFADGSIWLGRNPDGPCDHEVGVVKFEDSSGVALAVLLNWPCHGTASGQDNYQITGDWPGAAARTLKNRFGKDVVVAVTAGASADINPIYGPGTDFDEIEAVGYHVGTEAANALASVETYPVHSLQTAVASMHFPGKKPCPDRSPRASYEKGPDVEVRLTAFKIGELVLCGVSGELMTEIGLGIKKKSPFSGTFIVTHCNGSSGYICTDKAFSEGGYEVQVTRLVPGAEGPLVRRALELIRTF
jgi:Neutral/alkaline non-lysosomal ceramidase, N-terminal